MKYVQYKDGEVVGVYGCPQSDALDDKGNVIARGVPTVMVEDNHPDLLTFVARQIAAEQTRLK